MKRILLFLFTFCAINLSAQLLPGVVASSIAEVPSGLRDYWPLDESISPVIDVVGGDNGGIVGVTLGVEGHKGTACSFDGNDRIVQINQAVTGAMSISVWAKLSTYQAYNNLFGTDTGYGFMFNYWDDKYLIQLGAANRATFNKIGNSTSDGLWHHWVFVITGIAQSDIDNSAIYVDKVPCTQNKITKTGIVTVTELGYIGFSGAGYAKGVLDDIRIYDHALTQNEINMLYDM